MSDNTSIEWTDATWNPTRGCRRISSGCENCYAEKVAARFCGEGLPYEGLITFGKKNEARWSGLARFVPDKLDQPLRWTRGRRIFVDSMSDLFYEGFTDEQIDQVFAVMLLSPKHTFQVLTKRPKRMQKYLAAPDLYQRILAQASVLRATRPRLNQVAISNPSTQVPSWIWLGCSVEDQPTAEERILWLLSIPAAVRYISYEPALGEVDLTRLRVNRPATPDDPVAWYNALTGHVAGPDDVRPEKLHWVIIGGESGDGARPFEVEWARRTVQQCRKAGVPVFVKQLGADVRDRNDAGFLGQPGESWDIQDLDQVEHNPNGYREEYQGAPVRIRLRNRKGGDMAEWPRDLRVREFPAVAR